jgi:hypothetical protein
MIDPRFKLRWCETDKVTEYIDLLNAKTARIAPTDSSSPDTTVSSPSKKTKSDDVFSFTIQKKACLCQIHWKVINQITITCSKPSIKLPLQGF